MQANCETLAAIIVAKGNGEGEFFAGLLVIAAVITFVILGMRKKRSVEEEPLRKALAEIERRRSHQQLSGSVQLGNVIKPGVVALLESTPATTEDRDKFEGNTVLQAALEIHEALTAWMSMLR